MKPHIKLTGRKSEGYNCIWQCAAKGRQYIGFGISPRSAYMHWLRQSFGVIKATGPLTYSWEGARW